MKQLLRLLALIVALGLLVAACGGGGEEVAEEANDVEETIATETEAVAETTTTNAPTAPDEEVEDDSDAEQAISDGLIHPLTGVALGDGDDPDHAAVVVKISNNDNTARAALDGLDQADIIYEERIEVEATRFAAVFHSSLPEQVGSVRSGRTSDVQIVANLNRPVFAFSGANNGVNDQLRSAENDGVLLRASAEFGSPEFSRINDFAAPDNLVADVSRLVDVAPEDSEAPSPVFDYSNNVRDLGRMSPGVVAQARSNAQYVWSESDGGYLRFQAGDPHVTRDGAQITPENVVILTTSYVPSQIDAQSVDAVTIGEGRVEVYSNGARVVGTWSRAFPRDPYTLTTADGEVIGLTPGQTWVSLSPAGTSSEISDERVEALVG